MIQHVYERVARAAAVPYVAVATDDQRIFDAVRKFGGNAVMTAAETPAANSGRCAHTSMATGAPTVMPSGRTQAARSRRASGERATGLVE